MVRSCAAVVALACGGSALGQQPPRYPLSTGMPAAPERGLNLGRPAPGSPPPTIAPPTTTVATVGAGGKVLYFQKPANALSASGTDTSHEVVQASATAPPVPVLPDSTAAQPSFLPPVNRTPELPPLPEPVPTLSAPVTVNQTGDRNETQESTSNKQPTPNTQEFQSTPNRPIPSPAAIFIMYDDQALEQAVVQSMRIENPKLQANTRFPDTRPVVAPGTPYVPKTATYPPRSELFEANYVVYRRLHFEEKNTERAGWDLGIIQPFVSTAYFYRDTLLWPNSFMVSLFRGTWDTSAGKCQPGCPTPYYLYPPGLTISGTMFEAGLITGLAFIIP